MNKRVFKTLEYDKIIETLASFASTDGGRKACEGLKPCTELEEIRRVQTHSTVL